MGLKIHASPLDLMVRPSMFFPNKIITVALVEVNGFFVLQKRRSTAGNVGRLFLLMRIVGVFRGVDGDGECDDFKIGEGFQ